jgi:S-adenosylmethionine synthetase
MAAAPFSGKDPSKVDRSAAYYLPLCGQEHRGCRLADKCEIQVAYAIGVAKRLSITSAPTAPAGSTMRKSPRS